MPINPQQPQITLNEGLNALNTGAAGLRSQNELALRQKQQLADFLTKGIKPDASGLNDYGQNVQNTAVATNNFSQAGMDPTSQRSQGLAQFIGKSPSGMGAPQGVAANDLEKVQPILDAAIKAKSAKSIFGEKRNDIENKDLQKDQQGLVADPEFKRARQGINEGKLALGQLDDASSKPDGSPGNPISGAAMGIVMAKLKTGTSRLNQNEIMAFGGAKGLEDRLNQSMQQAQNGTLTKENVGFLKQVIQKDLQIHQQTMQQATTERARQRAIRKGIPLSEAINQLSLSDPSQPAQTTQPPANDEYQRYLELMKKAGP